jgi:hypothetical protein
MAFRSLLVGLLFAVAAGAMATDSYQFQFNGKPAEADIISLGGEPSRPQPGDVATVRGFSFVLEDYGLYDLRVHDGDSNRLFRAPGDGTESLLACRICTVYERLSDGENAKGHLPEGKVVNPLDGLTSAALSRVRGVQIENGTASLSSELQQVDPSKCIFQFDVFNWKTDNFDFGSLPRTVRYLRIVERVSPSSFKVHLLSEFKQLRMLDHMSTLRDYDLRVLEPLQELRWLSLQCAASRGCY